jgi:uncharacterized protein (TIGR02001 family)
MTKIWGRGRRKAGGVSLGVAVALVVSAGLAGAADAPRNKRRVVVAEPAPAPVESKFIDFAFGFRAASDYNFRGISQSDRGFSPQGYGELQVFDNFLYAGVAGYGVDLPTKPLAEIDLTAGVRPKWGPLTFDFGVIGYVYPDETQFLDPFTGAVLTPRDTDFLEVAGKVSYTYQDALTLGAGVFHTGDFLGSGANGTYFNATAKYAIPEGILPAGFAISGELGRYELGRVDAYLGGFELIDYTYWNAGVSYTWKNITLDLRYHDTDLNKDECFINTTDPRGVNSGSLRSKWCSEAFVATLSVDFTASQLGIFAPTR